MDYELYHHGILGMKWGIRRYQNKDGSLTSAGRKRYYQTANSITRGLVDYRNAVNTSNKRHESIGRLRDLGENESAQKLREDSKRLVDKSTENLRNAMLQATDKQTSTFYKEEVEDVKDRVEAARKEMSSILTDDKRLQKYIDKYIEYVYTKEDLRQFEDQGLSIADLKKGYMDAAREAPGDYGDEYESIIDFIAKNDYKISSAVAIAENSYKNAMANAEKMTKDAIKYANRHGDFDRLIMKNDSKNALYDSIGRGYIRDYTKVMPYITDHLNVWYDYESPYYKRER